MGEPVVVVVALPAPVITAAVVRCALPVETVFVIRYAALIRGINVGGRNMLAMSDLRGLLTDLGYDEVATLLQSGNAVFTATGTNAAAVAERIRAAIADLLGLHVGCQARSAAEIRAVLEGHPLQDVATDGSRLFVHFLASAPTASAYRADDPTQLAPSQIVLGDRVIYQWCPDGLRHAPQVGAFVEKRLGVAVTARNWNTVTKLDGLLSSV